MLRRARFLLGEAADIESLARTLAAGVESRVRLAVDPTFPDQVLLPAIGGFVGQFPSTRIDLVETGAVPASGMLVSGEAQLAITPVVPTRLSASQLADLEMVCVGHSDHPLHALDGGLTERDLDRHRELMATDSGTSAARHAGRQGSKPAIEVSAVSMQVRALCHGLGYAWCPAPKIRRELEDGVLKPLRIARGGSRTVNLHLVFADEEGAGPATHALAKYIEGEAVALNEGARHNTFW